MTRYRLCKFLLRIFNRAFESFEASFSVRVNQVRSMYLDGNFIAQRSFARRCLHACGILRYKMEIWLLCVTGNHRTIFPSDDFISSHYLCSRAFNYIFQLLATRLFTYTSHALWLHSQYSAHDPFRSFSKHKLNEKWRGSNHVDCKYSRDFLFVKLLYQLRCLITYIYIYEVIFSLFILHMFRCYIDRSEQIPWQFV